MQQVALGDFDGPYHEPNERKVVPSLDVLSSNDMVCIDVHPLSPTTDLGKLKSSEMIGQWILQAPAACHPPTWPTPPPCCPWREPPNLPSGKIQRHLGFFRGLPHMNSAPGDKNGHNLHTIDIMEAYFTMLSAVWPAPVTSRSHRTCIVFSSSRPCSTPNVFAFSIKVKDASAFSWPARQQDPIISKLTDDG